MVNRLDQALQMQRAGRHEEAASLLKKVNAKKKTRTVLSVLAESRSNRALGDWQAAREVLMLGLSDKISRAEYVDLSIALASAFAGGGELREAMKVLKKAEKSVPIDKKNDLMLNQALVYSQDYQFARAVKLCLGLIESERDAIRGALLLMDLAIQLSDLELFDQALDVIEKDIGSFNDVNLLALVERVSRYRRHRSAVFYEAAKGRGLMPNRINLFAARKQLDNGDYDSGQVQLDEVDERRLDATLKPLFWKLRGTLQDRAGEFTEAFNSYRRMNEASRAVLPIDWQQTGFDPVQPFERVRENPQAFESPVPLAFIVGFPRSGTTLLEIILDSQAGIEVIDEKPIVHALKTRLVDDGYDLENCLPQLEDKYLDQLREQYFRHAEEYVRPQFADVKLLVDKNPMQMIDLPLINALFPQARILNMVRHPLDTILSCYQQTFEINSQMPFFTDWRSCFSHYHNVINSFERYRSRLAVEDYVVRYEDLVVDFDVEVEKIFEFLNFSPDAERYRQFGEHAQKRIVNTPSSSQVRKGLYSGATFRWRNYRDAIDEHLELVMDDIDRLGYEVE